MRRFTLVELLIGLALIGIAAALSVSFARGMSESKEQTQTREAAPYVETRKRCVDVCKKAGMALREVVFGLSNHTGSDFDQCVCGLTFPTAD